MADIQVDQASEATGFKFWFLDKRDQIINNYPIVNITGFSIMAFCSISSPFWGMAGYFWLAMTGWGIGLALVIFGTLIFSIRSNRDEAALMEKRKKESLEKMRQDMAENLRRAKEGSPPGSPVEIPLVEPQ